MIWIADVSRKPLPSVRPAPLPSRIRPLPLPSAWAPPPRNWTLETFTRPAYIESRLSLSDATLEEVQKPEKVQNLQMSIACALRLPLEQVRIQTIRRLDAATGATTPIEIDLLSIALQSNGTVVCYKIDSIPQVARLLQGSAATKSTVQVDYAIVDPPKEVLMLNTTEFKELVASSLVIREAAQSVGSASVSAEIVEVTGPTGPAGPSSTPIAPAASAEVPAMPIGIGAGAAALVLLVAGAYFAFTSRAKRARQQALFQINPGQQLSESSSYEVKNIIHTRVPLGRQAFTPSQV